jgi:dihydrofolate reductase
MRQLVVCSFLTLDGVMQAPGAPEEDPDGDFNLGGWQASYLDDVTGSAITAFMDKPFDLLLGRKTYDIFAGYWPQHVDGAVGQKFAVATKYVASRATPMLPWERSVLLEGEVAQSVAALKAQAGPELQVYGSGDLVQTLRAHGLVDRYFLWIHPVVVGSGKRLFPQGTASGALRLIDSRVSTTGVMIGTYEPAGDVVTGTIE